MKLENAAETLAQIYCFWEKVKCSKCFHFLFFYGFPKSERFQMFEKIIIRIVRIIIRIIRINYYSHITWPKRLFDEECSSLTTKRFPDAQEIALQKAAIALDLSGQCTSTITLLQLEGRSPFQFEDDCNYSWGVKQMCGAQKWCNLKMHVFAQRGLVPMHKSADRLLKEENVCQFDVNVYTGEENTTFLKPTKVRHIPTIWMGGCI